MIKYAGRGKREEGGYGEGQLTLRAIRVVILKPTTVEAS